MEPGTHADLDAVGTGVDQRLGAFAGGGLAADDVHVRRGGIGLEPADHLQHALGVAVRGVHEEGIHTGVDERHGAFPAVAEEADGRADAQAAFVVLGGERVLLGLGEVLGGDQALEPALLVNERELLDLVRGQLVRGFLAADADVPGDERHLGHDVADQPEREVRFRHEAGVAVGDDAQQPVALVHDRQPGDAVACADLVQLGQRGLGADGQRVGDHAGFAALDPVHLVGLVGDGKVAVHDAEAALAGHGDGHPGLRDGVHRGGQQRGLDRDALGDPGGRVRFRGDHVGVAGQEQDVVVRQADEAEGVVFGLGHECASYLGLRGSRVGVATDDQPVITGLVCAEGHAEVRAEVLNK